MSQKITVELSALAVEARCRALCLSQSDVARRARLSRMTAWKAIKGKPVGTQAARAVARALRVSIQKLMMVDAGVQTGQAADLNAVAGLPRQQGQRYDG